MPMSRRDAIRAVLAMPAVSSVQVANVGPSDVIVLETDEMISMSSIERIEEYAKKVWPDRKVVVLSSGLKMRIVRDA